MLFVLCIQNTFFSYNRQEKMVSMVLAVISVTLLVWDAAMGVTLGNEARNRLLLEIGRSRVRRDTLSK
jgi:hypothetical protein